MRRERIEAFVTGRLTEAERSAFEADMRADETLRAEVEIERVLQNTLPRTPELRFRELVQQVSEAQEKVGTRDGGVGGTVIPIERGRWMWWAAASVFLLVGAGVLTWYIMHQDRSALAMRFAEVHVPQRVRGGHGTDPSHDSSLVRLWQLRANGDAAGYLSATERLLRTDSSFQALHGDVVRTERMMVLLGMGNVAGAMEERARVPDGSPSPCELDLVDGLIATLQGREEMAVQALQQAVRGGCVRAEELDGLLP